MGWSADDKQRFADGDVLKAKTIPKKRNDGPTADEWDFIDPFDDSEEIVAVCDLENPESCESCQ